MHGARFHGGAGLRTGVSRISGRLAALLVLAAAIGTIWLIAAFRNIDGAPDARGPANPRSRPLQDGRKLEKHDSRGPSFP
jgi:hypothetical protein